MNVYIIVYERFTNSKEKIDLITMQDCHPKDYLTADHSALRLKKGKILMKAYEDLSRIRVQEAIQQGLAAQRLQRQLHPDEPNAEHHRKPSSQLDLPELSLARLFRLILSPGKLLSHW